MDTGGSTARYFGQWAEHREGINRRLIHGPGIDAILAEVTSASGTPAQVWSLGRDGSGHVTHVDAVDTGGAPTASALRRYSLNISSSCRLNSDSLSAIKQLNILAESLDDTRILSKGILVFVISSE